MLRANLAEPTKAHYDPHMFAVGPPAPRDP